MLLHWDLRRLYCSSSAKPGLSLEKQQAMSINRKVTVELCHVFQSLTYKLYKCSHFLILTRTLNFSSLQYSRSIDPAPSEQYQKYWLCWLPLDPIGVSSPMSFWHWPSLNLCMVSADDHWEFSCGGAHKHSECFCTRRSIAMFIPSMHKNAVSVWEKPLTWRTKIFS